MRLRYTNFGFFSSFIIYFFLAVLTGCATPQALKLYSASNEDPLDVKFIDLGEASLATYYNFTSGDAKKNILFFFSGTGCFSHKNYIKPYLFGLKNINVFVLQKNGVSNNDFGFICSKEFDVYDNFDVWYQRQKKFISKILEGTETTNTNIILMGVSEGANVAGALINSNTEFTHLVLISPLGKKMPNFLTEIGPNFGISKVEIEKKITEINNNPLSNNDYFAGKTFKYWSSFSKYDPQVALGANIKPTLIGMGELDINTPPEPVKAIFDAKILKGDVSLDLIIYPKANHILVDAKGNSNRELFLDEVNKFLTKTPKH